jgi:hypothetical protein
MLLSKFVTFNIEEKERIDRILDEYTLDFFFESILYSDIKDNFNNNDKICFIGYNYCSNLFEIDILTDYISPNYEWLFSYDENKSFYKKSITDYINNTFISHINSFNYEIIDYFFDYNIDDNPLDYLINDLLTKKFKKILIFDKSIYYILEDDNTIYNISLKMVKYFNGIDGVKKIINFMYNYNQNIILDEKHVYFNKIRDVIDINIIDDVLLERYLITLI